MYSLIFWTLCVQITYWFKLVISSHSVQFSSVAQLSLILWPYELQHNRPPYSWSLSKLMSIESMMPSSHLILCRPLLPPSIRVFSNESVLRIRWTKCWSFSLSISPSDEYSGLIACRIDWLDLPTIQGTLKSFLQHHRSKAFILWHSAFFIVQLSHPYMTTGKTIDLDIWTFVGKDKWNFVI